MAIFGSRMVNVRYRFNNIDYKKTPTTSGYTIDTKDYRQLTDILSLTASAVTKLLDYFRCTPASLAAEITFTSRHTSYKMAAFR